jgi:hypothetical protein
MRPTYLVPAGLLLTAAGWWAARPPADPAATARLAAAQLRDDGRAFRLLNRTRSPDHAAAVLHAAAGLAVLAAALGDRRRPEESSDARD